MFGLLIVLIIALTFQVNGCFVHRLSSEEQIKHASQEWNVWLGKHKKERIRAVGAPDKCSSFPAGEEVCEWVYRGVTVEGEERVSETPGILSGGSVSYVYNYEHRLIYTYDRQGIACEWHYRGDWGQATSGDAKCESIQ